MMKSTITLLLILCSLQLNAQTRYYKYSHTIKESTGMKLNEGSHLNGWYITFTNGKQTCYFSDQNGTATVSLACIYVGFQNGMHVYKQEKTEGFTFNGVTSFQSGGWDTLYFSKDYSRMNWRSELGIGREPDEVRVLLYVPNPEQQNSQRRMY